MSSLTEVPPMQAWHSMFMKSPMATTTFWICWANSRVGARMRAWHALMLGSIFWRTEMEKVAVFPVPDWAWAITSLPVSSMSGCALCVKDSRVEHIVLTLDDWHDSALLDSRWALETVGVDSAEELALEVHGIEGVGGLIVVGLDLRWRGCQSLVSQRTKACAAYCPAAHPLPASFLSPQMLSRIRLPPTVIDLPASMSSSPLESAMIAVRSQSSLASRSELEKSLGVGRGGSPRGSPRVWSVVVLGD